jgi:hypothetical protein
MSSFKLIHFINSLIREHPDFNEEEGALEPSHASEKVDRVAVDSDIPSKSSPE